ncbi:MAG: lysophospholipid acyltransferase family protein, partial [Oscillospiraceae bacterium]
MNFWYRLFYILAAPFICLFYPFRVSGRENIPEDACVICANHSGLLDPCFAAIAFGIKRHIYFMAKSEFFNNFFLKHVFNAAGVFPVSREETDIT